MFGFLRRKKHEEDYDDLRTNILGEAAFRPMQPEAADNKPAQYNPQDDFTPKTRDVFEPTPTPAFPNSFEKPEAQTSKNYEIYDRLSVIESQLAAIRSMTETINERLKNMESRSGMPRRY